MIFSGIGNRASVRARLGSIERSRSREKERTKKREKERTRHMRQRENKCENESERASERERERERERIREGERERVCMVKLCARIHSPVGTRPAYLVLSAKVEYILVRAPRLGPRNVSREPGATPFASRRSRRM